MRRLVFGLLLLCACNVDRERPNPTEISGGPADLVAYVRRPLNNATIPGARDITIEIQATDVARDALTGLGYIVRKNTVIQNSVVVRFSATTDTTIDFTYTVPDLPTNTQLDISALAFGSHGEFRESPAAFVVVVKCQETIPGC